jgi:hypothetical protein
MRTPSPQSFVCAFIHWLRCAPLPAPQIIAGRGVPLGIVIPIAWLHILIFSLAIFTALTSRRLGIRAHALIDRCGWYASML